MRVANMCFGRFSVSLVIGWWIVYMLLFVTHFFQLAHTRQISRALA